MKILILGGTQFVGLHITQAAVSAGHEVTLFNRGKTQSDLFPDLEKRIGNRDPNVDDGLSSLQGRRWDAVIDVNGYTPRIVRAAAEALKDSVNHYVFISTLAVYAKFDVPNQDETSPLAQMPEGASQEEVTGATYGALKVLCEQAAQEVFPDRALIIRPGYVVGPHDPTDRFTYWIRRVTQGGEMLCPVAPEHPVQFIDGRDLADFTVSRTASRSAEVYNATGPAQPTTWGEVFETTKSVCDADTTLTWVSYDFLQAQGVTPNEIPMISPPERTGGARFSVEKAKRDGLSYRPLADTVRDLLAWDIVYGKPQAGLSLEREAELLRAWKGR
jgi:2'-hydroxyisoflavone reductase